MKFAILSGLLFLATGITLGAFGAHGLREYFMAREEDIWKTSVFYQIIHGLGLLIISLLATNNTLEMKTASRCAKAIIAGVFIFSGSLYLLVLTRERWLGAVTPIGGALLICSWAILAYSFARKK